MSQQINYKQAYGSRGKALPKNWNLNPKPKNGSYTNQLSASHLGLHQNLKNVHLLCYMYISRRCYPNNRHLEILLPKLQTENAIKK